jgi:two-component system, OmpR family, sensor kinase
MTRWRRWWAGRTLRARLVVGVLLIFLAGCAAVGTATVIALQIFLLGQLDAQLPQNQQLAHLVELQARGQGQDGFANPPPPGTPGTLGAWVSASGRLAGIDESIRSAKGWKTVAPSSAIRRILLSLPDNYHPYTRTLPGLGEYRLIAIPGQQGDVFIAGLPLADLSSTITRLERIEVVVFGAVLVVIGLAVFGVVRLSLRPLGRVTTTANEVTQLPLASGEVDLSQRVPDADPRTEVGQLGSAVNRMLGHVKNALARRQATESQLRQFIADASHELRTPIAGIGGYAELGLRAPQDSEFALLRVQAAAGRMGRLVDDLLLLARLDAGEALADEPVDLTLVTLEATNEARVAGPDHKWILELPREPVTIRGDQYRLHQMLANLLANARAHTPPGSTVTVRLDAGQDSLACLTVTDDGPGIPGDLQPSAFERFVRGDTARTHAGGSTGLGLAIVHGVVTAHHGRVTLASQPGQTTFTVLLPAAPGGQALRLPAGAQHAAGSAACPGGGSDWTSRECRTVDRPAGTPATEASPLRSPG